MVGVLTLPDPFHLEVQEEAFSDGVVPAVTLAAHATDEAVAGQHVLVELAGVHGVEWAGLPELHIFADGVRAVGYEGRWHLGVVHFFQATLDLRNLRPCA